MIGARSRKMCRKLDTKICTFNFTMCDSFQVAWLISGRLRPEELVRVRPSWHSKSSEIWEFLLLYLVGKGDERDRWQCIVRWLNQDARPSDYRLLHHAIETTGLCLMEALVSEADIRDIVSEQYVSFFRACQNFLKPIRDTLLHPKRLRHALNVVRSPERIREFVDFLCVEFGVEKQDDFLRRQALSALNVDAFLYMNRGLDDGHCVMGVHPRSLVCLIREIPDSVFESEQGRDSVARSVRWLAGRCVVWEDCFASLGNEDWKTLSTPKREFLWFSLRRRPLLSDDTQWKYWTGHMLRDLWQSIPDGHRLGELFDEAHCLLICLVCHDIVPYGGDEVVSRCNIVDLIEYALGFDDVRQSLRVVTDVCEYLCNPHHRFVARFPDSATSLSVSYWLSVIRRLGRFVPLDSSHLVHFAFDNAFRLVGGIVEDEHLAFLPNDRLRGVVYVWGQEASDRDWSCAHPHPGFLRDLAQLVALNSDAQGVAGQRALAAMLAFALDNELLDVAKTTSLGLGVTSARTVASALDHRDVRVRRSRIYAARQVGLIAE